MTNAWNVSYDGQASITLTKGQSIAALGGRIILSPIFLLSAFGKIANPSTYIGYIEAFGLPLPFVCLAAAILLESVGGIALIVGYQTRWTGALLAVFSAATAVLFHRDLADSNQFLHFWKNLAMAGGLLQLYAFGAGVLSLDQHLRK